MDPSCVKFPLFYVVRDLPGNPEPEYFGGPFNDLFTSTNWLKNNAITGQNAIYRIVETVNYGKVVG